MCLIGLKQGGRVEYRSKSSNNVIFGDIQQNDQKPKEIYDIIENMMPGSKKIEFFSKSKINRKGWF